MNNRNKLEIILIVKIKTEIRPLSKLGTPIAMKDEIAAKAITNCHFYDFVL